MRSIIEKKRMNKKGIVRIIEAAIAVLLVLGFLIFIQGKTIPKLQYSTTLYKIQHQVLIEVESNQDLRTAILTDDISSVNDYIKYRLNPYPMNFSARICSIEDTCRCLSCPRNTDLYADSIIVSTNLTNYDIKKLSLVMWFQPEAAVPRPITPEQPPAGCVEDWQCSPWSTECISGQQTRNCADLNDCGRQPEIETRTCVVPSPEVCDGLDNDNNGIADDGLTPPLCAKQSGVCSGSRQSCGGVSGWITCTDATYSAYSLDYVSVESTGIKCFDGKDNDCDGLTDVQESSC